MNNSPPTRASLILRLRSSDDAVAWEEFVEIYQPLIFRLARSKGLQDADALDLTQDVLTRVAHAINRFDPDPGKGSFRAWIGHITRNMVIDHFRAHGKRQVTADDTSIQQIIDSIPSPEDSQWFDIERDRQVFAWAADKIQPQFQPKTWEAFWLTAVQNQTASDVAHQLGLTLGAVYIARSRVMAKLKQKVQRQLDSETGPSLEQTIGPDSIQRQSTEQTRRQTGKSDRNRFPNRGGKS